MRSTKLHPVYCFGYVKYILLLAIGPIWAAISARNIDAAFVYLREDFYLFLAVGLFVVALWFATNYSFDGQTITVEEGLFFQRTHIIPLENITCLSLEQPFVYRLLGATKITVYFETPSKKPSFSFPLPTKRAQRIAHAIFPLDSLTPFYQPTGRGRFSFAFLSTDVVASLVVIFSVYSQLKQFLGAQWELSAQQGISTIAQIFSIFLPAGLALSVTFLVLVLGAIFTSSLVRTGGFSTSCSERLIVVEGGFFNHREFRFLRSKITSSTIRVSFASRLIKRYPLYISAGGYSGMELPVFLYKKGDEARIRQLLPGFRAPFTKYCDPLAKRPMRYLGPPIALLGASLLALLACWGRAPSLAPFCVAPILLSIGLGLFAIEGVFREGVVKKNGTVSISACRNFTRYITQVYNHDYMVKTTATSLNSLQGLCNLTLTTGDRRKLRVRGIKQQTASRLFGTPGGPLLNGVPPTVTPAKKTMY
ncbi:PH domain-containing protein [Ruminococcaceae bacterium OttesenSCG-928-N02]|nr:PH domain-containing protein [Ruminococcaceae bacterium OttesenSCG-928-N02]